MIIGKFAGAIKRFIIFFRKERGLQLDNTYKSAGVDIEAGDETVRRIKSFAKSTFNKNVISDIGLFGGFYELDLNEYKKNIQVIFAHIPNVRARMEKAMIGMSQQKKAMI